MKESLDRTETYMPLTPRIRRHRAAIRSAHSRTAPPCAVRLPAVLAAGILAALFFAACGSAEGGPAGVPPGEIGGLTKQSAGDTWAALTWTDPADDDIKHIEITWTPGGGTPLYVPKSLSENPNGAVITGLTPGTPYTVTVKVVNNSGSSSSVSSPLYLSAGGGYPRPVEDLAAVSGDGQVTLNWTNPAGIDHIRITGGPEPLMNISPGTQTVTITGLTNERFRVFTVWTVDSLGGETPSNITVALSPGGILASINNYAAGNPGAGDTTANPVPLTESFELSSDSWKDILNAIDAAGKYVTLDLLGCSRGTHTTGGGLYTDGRFDPLPGNQEGKYKIVSLTLPDPTVSIGERVFQGWTSLTLVRLPASLTTIGANPFTLCRSLTGITVDGANPNYKSQDGMLLNKAGTAVIACPPSKSGGITTLSSVTSAGAYAFYGCSFLTSVSLPAATSIGDYAFYGCTNLTTVDLSLAASIGDRAFYGCSSLASVSLPAAASIGEYAFRDCSSLTTVNLSASLTSVRDNSFIGCRSLTGITVAAANPNYKSQSGMLLEKDGSAWTLVAYPGAAGAVTVSTVGGLPVKSIGNNAFYGCTGLTSVTLPSVESIGAYAFFDTGPAPLTLTLPKAAPSVAGSGSSASYPKDVTVKTPLPRTGYDLTWKDDFKRNFGTDADISLTIQNL
ncbi:MAG: leucine-rich repeat protein [Treponema sp.]|jgi:hypothetical protein|nr:leucine-rich repeat protein [Treponema sp.]